MRILVAGFSKIKYMPYTSFYFENLSGEENEIHLLIWNRDLQTDIEPPKNIIKHEFVCYQEDQVSKLKKIKSFYNYYKYATQILKKVKPDKIIILHTFPGFLLFNQLKKKYRDKFIFDYRDSTYEKYSFFRKRVGRLVQYSYATFVSSDAFRILLPKKEKEKIYTSHNLLIESLKHREKKMGQQSLSSAIKIAFWGVIREENLNKEIIRKISKDSRFELHYYGREQKVALNLKNYVKEIQANNVFFHGEYVAEDRYDFVKKTDIIHNIYSDNNMMKAISNKYYDGLIFYCPQLCMKNSFMGQCASKNGLGLEIDPYEDDFADKIVTYYRDIEYGAFYQRCDETLQNILSEYIAGTNIIKNFEKV